MIYEDQSRGRNKPTTEEIMKMVEDINNFYREETLNFDEFLVEIHSDGEGIIIMVLGNRIWYSEDDNRPCDENENKIPLETHIIDKIILIIRDLNKLAFK